jgi:hypothetical protein
MENLIKSERGDIAIMLQPHNSATNRKVQINNNKRDGAEINYLIKKPVQSINKRAHEQIRRIDKEE